ncbi:hypothetical protein [Palleronia sp.]|uniref:hypothetical protein n=1 Tax=Palleronia sp. TaxID=1940284 RepID=UPI0035C86E5F
MAKSPKGSGNPLLPIAIIAVVVLAVLVGVFALSGGEETPPDQPTVIAEDDINAEPAGSGTVPEGQARGGVNDAEEGEADEVEEGVTELVDDVDPAPADIDSIPATDYVDSTGPDIEGETLADEEVADSVSDEVADSELPEEGDEERVETVPADLTSVEEVQAGGANAEQDDDTAARIVDEPLNQSATEEFLLDEETIGTGGADNVDTPGPQESTEAGPLPAGRDAVTDLNPSECQDIVRDTDSGGAAFIPTPSGPDANTRGECLDDPEERPE